MYPANRDEILKGLTDLVSTIRKILQAKDVEEAAQREAALASHGQEEADQATAQDGVATISRPRTAAEALFADFPVDDDGSDGAATSDSNDSADDAPVAANPKAEHTAQAEESSLVAEATVIEQAEPVEPETVCLAVQVSEDNNDGETVLREENSGASEGEADNAEAILAAATVGENVVVSEETKFALGNENELTAEKVAQALELRFKICKHIIMQVDNSLGDFRDMLDTMDYYHDEKFEEAQKLVDELEECTTDLIAYLRSHNRY